MLYNLDYSKSSGTIHLDKYDLPLPERPPLKHMLNYGLSKEKQIFRRTEIPKAIQRRKKNLTDDENTFIEQEHHRRHNGIWVLINGEPIYITGPYYHFLNYHNKEDGEHPGFRYIQCLVYLFWDMVVRDINCYGAFLIGPRRAGKTEFTLGMTEEYSTRVRNIHAGMQSKNDIAAFENFQRITMSNKSMIWYMKPVSKGSDDPKDKLEFKYPSGISTNKTLSELAEKGEEDEDKYSERELGSWIDYQPSIAGAYDRQELHRWILNEAGKLEKMSLLGCWDKVKPCLHHNAGKNIIGKAWFETTIEEVNDDQIEEVNSLYYDSSPLSRDDNGRTTSGLYSLFLSHHDCYDEDEFGFPKREEAELFLKNQIKDLTKKKKYSAIALLLRKNPRNIEDALTPSGSQSAFNKDRLQDILKRIEHPESFGFDPKQWTTRGNFIWSGGQLDTKVIFIPDENGKFEVSQLLKDGEDCACVDIGGIKYPANVHKHRGGCDPYEHDEVVDKGRASKGAGVVFRLYDDNEDGAKLNDGSPIDWAWEWLSKQPICDYVAREDDPDVFFEDMLMMHFYYGTQMNVENNKQSIKKHFRRRGYGEYLMTRPESTMDAGSKSSSISQTGTPATTDTIDQYFMAIAHYVMVYCNAIKHRRIIVDLLEMNKKNRGKKDLGVAYGWALIACEKKYYKSPIPETTSTEPMWFQYRSI